MKKSGPAKIVGGVFRGMKGAVLLFAVCCLLIPAVPAGAAMRPAASIGFDGPPGSSGVPADWKLKVHRGTAETNLISENGETVLHMKSIKSSFALEHQTDINVVEYPYITWTWKALSLPSRGDVREKSKDDQALQLLVAFKDGRVLSYVWDANAPAGTIEDESLPWPLSITIKVIVINSGESGLGKWITNTRNVYEDYRNFFRKDPPLVEGIRLQMNTQHTGDSAEGFIGDVAFSKGLS
jgi:Protein of unknown function (DUF3047)